jgi:hypothetical protein
MEPYDLRALLGKLQDVQAGAQQLADPDAAYREALTALLEAVVDALDPQPEWAGTPQPGEKG